MVFQSDGSTWVSDAEIRVEVRSGLPCGTSYTIASEPTDNGIYMIRGVPPGTWYLGTDNMGQSNYYNEWWTGGNSTTDCNNSETFTINAGNRLQGFDFQLNFDESGDINGDRTVGLSDAILAMKVVIGLNSSEINLNADVNGDGKIGIEEVIYILQEVSGRN